MTMLGRALKDSSNLPFPDNFFVKMVTSTQLTDNFHQRATRLLNLTLASEMSASRYHPRQEPSQWKFIGDRNGLELYRERGYIKGKAIKVTALGQINGTLDDVLLGLHATTNGACKTQRAIMHRNFLDAAVLCVFNKDSFDRNDRGVSYEFAGVKWLACAPTGTLVHKRDLCWYEELGCTKDANGNDVGYLVMQSVEVGECPPFEQQKVTRSTAAVCYTFRSLPKGRVEVFMMGHHTVGGKSRSWNTDSIIAELWLGIALSLECAKSKRLSKLVCDTETFISYTERNTCDICDLKFRMLKSNQNCKLCGRKVCDHCRLTKLIYPSHNTGNFPCSYYFCKPCLSVAKNRNPDASQSFPFLQTSYRSELNESRSAPSTSILSFSSHSVPKQSAQLPTPINFQKRNPSSRSNQGVSRYSSARITMSSNPYSSSYASPVSTSHNNPSPSLQSSHAMRSTESPTVSSPIPIGRSISDSIRRKTARKGLSNCRMPTRRMLFQFSSHSIDSSWKRDGHSRVLDQGYISDSSIVSEDEDEEVDVRCSSRRDHPPVYLYDGGESDVTSIFESDCSSLTESEPLDPFENDRLKYLPAYHSNEIGTIVASTPPPSYDSTSSGNFMERLLQINMAAEATYLMTKYNTSIQANSLR
ncbi:hypothetical protein CCR75_002863 [Bremia lactucae]|uniref:FYVE-type domain-containing protein n=1 Tax=Bremia lactucae TaxID=4779 RepID=A0A976IF59_BRELC|nr:hypothetical protein CCR75_002863 [Bremia lactucae]